MKIRFLKFILLMGAISFTLYSQNKFSYEVESFDFIMKRQLDSLVSVAELKAGLRVKLQKVDGVYSFNKEAPALALSSLEGEIRKYDLSALNAICLEMVRAFNDKGLISIFVGAEAGQIDRNGKDLRKNKIMQLAIWTGRIKQVRTRLSS